jgi:hypothetical protein
MIASDKKNPAIAGVFYVQDERYVMGAWIRRNNDFVLL